MWASEQKETKETKGFVCHKLGHRLVPRARFLSGPRPLKPGQKVGTITLRSPFTWILDHDLKRIAGYRMGLPWDYFHGRFIDSCCASLLSLGWW